MRYRKLSLTGDYTFGLSLSNFYIDQIEAVAQSIQTRLALYQGTWFLDTSAGVPWNTRVLGRRSPRTRDIVIKAVIIGTPGVTSLVTYSATQQGRQLTITGTVTTIYSTQASSFSAVV